MLLVIPPEEQGDSIVVPQAPLGFGWGLPWAEVDTPGAT